MTSHEKMLRAVDRLVGSGNERRSLDEMLNDILYALRDAAGADVDSVAVLLAGDDGRLHLRAAIGFDEELANRVSVPIGEGFAGKVAEMRAPVLLRDAANDPKVSSDALARRGTRALYGAPLMDAGRLVGVAHVGSCSAYEFSQEDVMLFRALCERATRAILRTQFIETLERTSRFREEFIGVLGHDLRSPLGAILGSAQLLLDNEKAPPERRRAAAQRFVRSATRMERLIAHVLDFTRARLGGGIPLHPSRCSLLALARDTADEVASSSKRRIESAGGTCAGNGIVKGSLKFSRTSSATLRCTVRMAAASASLCVDRPRRAEELAVVDVWNEGPPIPKGTKLFEPFERASSKKGGLGLGLYIAHEIVTAHGGRLSVRSDASGTTFTVRIPVAHQTRPARRRARSPRRITR